MDADTEHPPPHYPCGQMCQSCFLPFPIHQVSELPKSPRCCTSYAPVSPGQGTSFNAQCSPQSSFGLGLPEDSFSHALLPEVSAAQENYKTEMAPPSYHYTYGNARAEENPFPWDAEVTALPETDLSLFSPTTPFFNELGDPNQQSPFAYDFAGEQVSFTSPEIKSEYGFQFDQYRDQDYSSYPEPIFDNAFSPERAMIPSLSPPNSTGSSPPDDPATIPATSPPETKDGLLSALNENDAVHEDDTDNESVSCEEPYAQLIWRALMSAPGHKLVLKDIYDWFEKNTNKVKDTGSKGWQNSIRHNLSMNAAFEGVKDPTAPGNRSKRSNNAWGLTKRAQKEGVQSTTRYRKPVAHKKAARSNPPAPQRQASGAKGGRAARKAAKIRRAQAADKSTNQVQQNTDFAAGMGCSGDNNTTVEMATPIKYEPTETNDLTGMNLTLSQYELESLMGCTDLLPQSPFFCQSTTHDENQVVTDFSILDDQLFLQGFNC